MSRPTDWQPLCDADPTPGDPQAVAAGGRQYSDAASEIATQVATLRRLAAGNAEAWIGRSGDAFRGQAGTAADELDKTQRRYTAVASALTQWAPILDAHQQSAQRLLDQAKDVQSRLTVAGQPMATPAHPTPDQQREIDQAQQAQQRQIDALQGELDGLRSQLASLVDQHHADAHRVAQIIRDAIDHDGLKDSWWDDVCAFVGGIAGALEAIANALSWIATALVVVALFIPGVDVLAAGLLLLGAAALIHGTLAATGHGSWLNVGLDVLALATFGAGNVLARGAEAGTELATENIGRTVFQGAQAEIAASTRAEVQALSRTASGVTRATAAERMLASAAQSQLARRSMFEAIGQAERAKQIVAAARPSISTMLLTADRGLAQAQGVSDALARADLVRFPRIAAGISRFESLSGPAKGLLLGNLGEDLVRHADDIDGYFLHRHFLPVTVDAPGGE